MYFIENNFLSIFIYFINLCLKFCLMNNEMEINLQMREETLPFTCIGTVLSNLPTNLIGTQLNYLTDSTFFTIKSTNGEICVNRLIDRERLCPDYKYCCGQILCELKSSIFITNKITGEFILNIKLIIEIQDQNDNRPIFNKPKQLLNLSESTTIGTFINIIPAYDADIDPQNQIQRYSLIESTGTFKLDVTNLPLLRLELIKSLDREQIQQYHANLEACDPGACTKQILEIQILDENDNYPQLLTTIYKRKLIENIPIGTIVLKINATDLDSGDYGRILYNFYGNIDSDLLDTFELIQNTGEIRLKRSLAAHIRNNYEFKIIVCDLINRACNPNENSTADIQFFIEDVNNFSPSIHIVPSGITTNTNSNLQTMNKIQLNKQTNNIDINKNENQLNDELNILENILPSQIAVLTIRDDDIGDNARVTCSLNDTTSTALTTTTSNNNNNNNNHIDNHENSNNFLLTLNAPGIYSLRTARIFDYEIETVLRTMIICHDYGKPQQLTSARMITVQIIDVNEFQPEFSRRVYIGRVTENTPAGVEILTITAIDRDKGAVLRYNFTTTKQSPISSSDSSDLSNSPSSSSSSSSPTSSPISSNLFSLKSDQINHQQLDDSLNYEKFNQYFIIEPETGIIRTSQIPLDRETINSVTLVVLVTDSIVPPIFTATTTVSIEVLDENDNAPTFTNPSAKSNDVNSKNAFTIMENAPRFTQLSQKLEAKDPDQGDNGRVQFSLLSTYALTKTGRSNQFLSSTFNLLSEYDQNNPDLLLTDLITETGMTKHIVDQPIFRITPNGIIETLIELDRETVPIYILKIGVRDKGTQPLASTIMLKIYVLDANDNAPVWIFPTSIDRTINLTTSMKPGSLAGRLRAEDADILDAGRVEYLFLGPRGELIESVSLEEGLLNGLIDPANQNTKTILNTNQQMKTNLSKKVKHKGYRIGPLYLNGSTGEIWVAQLLTSGTINLHLRAQDQGTPRTHTDAWLTINVFIDPSEGVGFLSLGGDGTLNVTIILAMITVTAIISLFLIIGIVCVRRRPTRYAMARNVTCTTDGAVSPVNGTTTYSVDMNKDSIPSNINSAGWPSPIGMYGANHFISGQVAGGNTIMEDGQMFTTLHGPGSVMGYGAVVSPSETGSMIYVPQAQPPPSVMGSIGGSITPVPVDLTNNGHEYTTRNQMHTFGTITRNRGSIAPGVYAGPGGCAVAYEPHLDADSGDSGRGPSEEGNQFLLTDNYRNGITIPGSHSTYQYNTYTGYRPSSRVGFYRSNTNNSDNGNLIKAHHLNCSNTAPGSNCACYMLPDNTMLPNQYNGTYDSSNEFAIAYHPAQFSPHKSLAFSSEQQSQPYQLQFSRNEQPLPPIPPPRSPHIPGSNMTLRRTYLTSISNGQDNLKNEIHLINNSHNNNNNQYLHTQPQNYSNEQCDQSTNQTNSLQTPLKLDLRGQSNMENNNTIHNNENNLINNDETDSKQRRRILGVGLGPGLPPLATKQINSIGNTNHITENKNEQEIKVTA